MSQSSHDDAANWSNGVLKVYFAKGDARFWVPKHRPAFGWTINFAHPMAGLVMVAFAAATVLLGVLLAHS